MPARIVLILLVVAGIVLLLRWLVRMPPARLARTLKKSALYGGIGLLVILAMTGRLPWLFALAGAAVPIVQRLLTVWRLGQMAKRVGGIAGGGAAAGAVSGGQRSTIQTRFLRMWLDHDSGTMGGTVLEGRFRGRTLDQLSLEDKLALLGECRADPQSAAVLEAYLDRMHGETWRESDTGADRSANGAQAEGGNMTAQEAYQVLGLEPGASEAEIRDSHRRLMQKLHPDRGGSTYLAAKINQAKDLLLNR